MGRAPSWPAREIDGVDDHLYGDQSFTEYAIAEWRRMVHALVVDESDLALKRGCQLRHQGIIRIESCFPKGDPDGR